MDAPEEWGSPGRSATLAGLGAAAVSGVEDIAG